MTAGVLGWFIAGLCVLAFIALWFTVSIKEMASKWKSLNAIGEQVKMHKMLCMQERGGENDNAAQKILENKLMVYRKVEKDYYALLKKPINRVPGYVMGFYLSKIKKSDKT